METLRLWVYRDLDNRIVGEPDDGSMAWEAHRERERVLREVLDDPALRIYLSAEATDRQRPHELVETIIEVISGSATILVGMALYVAKVVGGQLDERIGNAVGRILDRLLSFVRRKKVGDLWIELPDGSRVAVDPNAQVTITLKDGKAVSFSADAPPSTET